MKKRRENQRKLVIRIVAISMAALLLLTLLISTVSSLFL